jgi:predicted SAM-dependent methyltransferase
MSAINYFTYKRSAELIREVYRVVKEGGVVRFGVQDLNHLAQLYIAKDREFFFQKLADGRERFEGRTLGDKFVSWFYGYVANGFPCRYVFDYESLAILFTDVGFTSVERMEYRQSRLDNIEEIDNRPDQMFFLEAVK